jgi:hypothetical protein
MRDNHSAEKESMHEDETEVKARTAASVVREERLLL